MSQARKPLSEFADEYEKAAEDEDDQAIADACEALAAYARGEDIPADVAHRIKQRAEEAGR